MTEYYIPRIIDTIVDRYKFNETELTFFRQLREIMWHKSLEANFSLDDEYQKEFGDGKEWYVEKNNSDNYPWKATNGSTEHSTKTKKLAQEYCDETNAEAKHLVVT